MSYTLTPQQTQIEKAFDSGANLIITARAGCGKTSTLNLLAHKPSVAGRPNSGIALAFNTKIRDELKERFPKTFEVLTLNGLGHRAWSAVIRGRLQVNADKNYNMIDDYLKDKKLTLTWEEKSIVKKLMDAAKTLGLVPADCQFQNKALLLDDQDSWALIWDWIDEAPNGDLTHIAKGSLNKSIIRAFQGYIDFNDQIYMPTLFGGKFPQVNVLMGDEVQDWSLINHTMVKKVSAQQLVLVGDPKQAIYAFRGAMSDSMAHLEKIITNQNKIVHLPLTVTFRCGKNIVTKNQTLVPDFQPAESNPNGEILYWPDSNKPVWTPSDVPNNAAILCRNNAPLISCALRFLKAKRPVVILGREFAERLKADIQKACKTNTPISQAMNQIRDFYNSKLKNNPTKSQLALISDRMSAFEALISEGEISDTKGLCETLDNIFSNSAAKITLATGHKAKGLEWDWVMHLNPDLIPASWAANDPEQEQQEYNIRYVIETRARNTLVLASLNNLDV